MGILQNEKHMGDAILQKTFTADYLTKKQVKNEGQLAQYHVKDDHEAIVSKELWEVVQLEIQRRKDYMKRYGLRTMGRNTDEQPFTNRVFCGVCGQLFWRRTLYRLNGSIKAWMCASKCKGKAVKGCINDTLLETDLHKAFVMAWNAMLENRDDFLERWKTQLNDQNPLVAFRAKQFIELTEKAKPMKELDVSIVSKTLDHCDIKPLGVIDFYFLDGSHIGLVTQD
jgi:23S rRNA maturation mini-RNase III